MREQVFSSEEVHYGSARSTAGDGGNSDTRRVFGAEYSAQGMHPDPKKVQGITEMTAPTDKQQLQSFLGMVNYMGTFIPNLSHHIEPLRAMLKKDNVFH